MSVHEKMTAIADQIRSLTGESERIGLDSMVSGLEQIQEAVDEAMAVLKSRGVAVPAGSSVIELAELINTIPDNGVDTSDATATTNDMAEGTTAYVDGQKITGIVPVITALTLPLDGTEPTFLISGAAGNGCGILITKQKKEFLFRPTGTSPGWMGVNIPQSEMGKFGDAAPEDVAAGKTFTSASGVKVTGTYTG